MARMVTTDSTATHPPAGWTDPQQAVRERRTMGPGFGPGSQRELMDEQTFTGRPSVKGRRHVISSVHYLATMGGLRILALGGNAIDAGVAAGLCINTVQPQLAMFGGVAPIVITPAGGEPVAISGLGRWPRAATLERYRAQYGDKMPGGLGRTVTPAAPDAWLTALAEYGTLSLAQVIEPALELASEGFPLGPELHRAIAGAAAPGGAFERWPSSAEAFLPGGPGSRVPELGEIYRQPLLAGTFRRLVAAESDAGGDRRARIYAARDLFYRGAIAREIAAFHQANGGLLTEADLAEFRVGIEPPARTTYQGYDVLTCGAWCQGPTLLLALALLKGFNLPALGRGSAAYLHTLLEALKLAFADRDAYFGDPDFVDVPLERLLSEEYASARRTLIRPDQAWPGAPPAGNAEALRVGARQETEHDTSYVCVVDADGNAFSATPSDGGLGGACVPGLGFPISSRGGQSWLDPSHPSALGPWKRPRLTPNPAMALRDGRIAMAFGCPGGDSQVQGMLQVFLNIVEFGMEPQAAIEAPRVVTRSFQNSFWPHVYEPGRVDAELRIPPDVRAALAALGHDVHANHAWGGTSLMCAVTADPTSGVLAGGADPRGDCYAAGW
jgi:gamma-glutamyltranspeptidase / glutathione hydrolase